MRNTKQRQSVAERRYAQERKGKQPYSETLHTFVEQNHTKEKQRT